MEMLKNKLEKGVRTIKTINITTNKVYESMTQSLERQQFNQSKNKLFMFVFSRKTDCLH